MLNLLAYALLQLAILLGSPKAGQPTTAAATETNSTPSTTTTPTSTTTPTPPPTSIGSEGWDND